MKFALSEINELIRSRRTIYPNDFSGREVQKEIIENLLNNAIWAPSHGMTQPWRFWVYQKEACLKLGIKLADFYSTSTGEKDFMASKHQKLIDRAKNSSATIVVGMERQDPPKIRETEEIEAVAAAIQNILLSATAYGLGSFWSTPKIIYNKEINHMFDLKEKDHVLGLIYLGYPKIEWPKGQRKPIEYCTHWMEI